MSNRSNTIDFGGDLLSAMIDPVFTPMEVFQYWQEIAPDFSYLGATPLNKDELTRDDHRMIVPVKDGEAPAPDPHIQKSGDAEILDAYFSLPLYLPGMSEVNERVRAFMIPDVSVEDDYPLSYARCKPAYPVLLSLTRNIVFQSPYFILSIGMNAGTWCSRHLQYKAIAEVSRILYEMEGADPLEGEVVKQTAELSNRLYGWETREVDFQRVREELWSAAYRLIKRFSKGETAILHALKSYSAPVDLSVGRAGDYRSDVPAYDPDTFKHQVWQEHMGWSNPTRSRAIAYWTSKKSTSEWDHFFQACMKGVKSTWPALVEVLKQPPVSPADIDRLLSFLADINWPGAHEALMCLLALGKPVLEYVDNSIKEATQQNDEMWLEYLEYVKNAITDQES